MRTTVAVISGGLDSTALAYELKFKGHDLRLMSFNYGQRHRKELEFAAATAERLGVPWTLVDLTGITHLLAGSSLTSDDVEVPDGHYAAESMRATVVPNRNAIMLNIAAGYAVSIGARHIATGVHAGDHYIYPDCRPAFISSLNHMLNMATEGHSKPGFSVLAPFVHLSKANIVRLGEHYKVPWRETWSCYKGGDVHCGTCGTCRERKEAFELADVPDPTVYADVQE